MSNALLDRHYNPQIRSARRWGLAVIALMGLTSVANAQSSSATQRPLNPPVPLEAFPAQPAPRIPGPAPLSIGPAPAFYPPPPVYAFDGRPVFVAPPPVVPVYGPPPVIVGPGPYAGGVRGPSPFEANYPPRPVPDAGLQPLPAEVRPPTDPANLRVSISELFLNRVIAREDVNPGPVRDFILGAQVTGRQTTVSKLRVDLIPSQANAQVRFVLNGDVQTMTTGVTPQATIDTAGKQQFVGVKDVFFDGSKLSTRHATVFIRANNQTVGATTALSGTILGGLADRIAYRAAERQKAAGEAAARDRLAERVFPSFDGEVDNQLAIGNRQLDSVLRPRLEAAKLMPSTMSAWSTDTQVYFQSYTGPDDVRSTIAQPTEPIEGEGGIRFSVHESFLNTLIQQSGLKGLKTTDKQIREMEEPFAVLPMRTQAVAPPKQENKTFGGFSLPTLPLGTDSVVTDIEFDDVEPATLRVENDRLILKIKAEFKPGGNSLIPRMEITIPIQAKIIGDKIRFTTGKPRVVTQDRPDPDGPQTIVELTVEKLIEAELDPLEFDRKLPASFWTFAGAPPQIASIKSDNGWIYIAVE